MHPAVAFCQALCKRASADGWQVRFDGPLFMWKHKKEAGLRGYHNEMVAGRALHAACVELDKRYYNLKVEL